MRHLVAIVALMFVLIVAGCGSGNNMTTSSHATLYAAGDGSQSIIRINDAAQASGNVTPNVISGSATLLSAVNGILVDESANRLFVGSQGATPTAALLIFDNASSKSGNVAPDRVVTGSATMLTLPGAMALDKHRNILYVADGNNVLIFGNASAMNGNVAPMSTLTAPFITFSPGGLFLDEPNDRLYISNPGGNEVFSFEHASQLGPVPTGSRSLSGAATGLAGPRTISVDGSGRLLVGNLLGAVTIYSNAGAVVGNTPPVATIQGSNTQFLSPMAIELNVRPGGADTGDLYVLDSTVSTSGQKVMVFKNIDSVNGNLMPDRVFTLPVQTGGLTRLTLDATR